MDTEAQQAYGPWDLKTVRHNLAPDHQQKA